MAAANRTSIEFVVRPKEDLFLEGTLRRLPRVTKGEAYPCQMQKNQNFSCLFRHYAKHNGLRKEDLIFSFVEELLPEQTPETVHLMPQDEIFVEHRKVPENDIDELPRHQIFYNQFKNILKTGNHSDIKFVCCDDIVLRAHKAIITARCEYFDAMFRPGGMYESQCDEIVFREHDSKTFSRMLEFLYTNEVQDIQECPYQETINLLIMSNEFLIDDLRLLCENRMISLISMENVGKLLLLATSHNANLLKDICCSFIQDNRNTLVADESFRQELENNSELGLVLFESSIPKKNVNTIGDDGSYSRKRRRTSNGSSSQDNDNDLNIFNASFGENSNGSLNISQGNATAPVAPPMPPNTIGHLNANVQDN